jgi:hypothetical protein
MRTAGINPVTPFGIASVNHKTTHKTNIASPYFIGVLIEETSIKKNIKKATIKDTTFFRINIICMQERIIYL